MNWNKRVVNVYSTCMGDTSCFIFLCSGDEWSVRNGILEVLLYDLIVSGILISGTLLPVDK